MKTFDELMEELKTYRVGHAKISGNVVATDEKDAMAKLRAKGVKGPVKLTLYNPTRVNPNRR
jgi:hypothetical protein